jgi:hypothetical protein
MKKTTHFKRAAAVLTGVLALAGLSQTANAQLITITAGKYTINAQGYSASVLTANPADFAPGAVLSTSGQMEDTWGIFQITSILDGNNVDYVSNSTYELWGMFYNSVDQAAIGVGNQVVFAAEGLKLDIYQVNVVDAGDTLWQNVFTQGIGGRIDLDSYTGITDVGTLVFQSELVGTMDSDYNTNTDTTNAEGNLTLAGVNTLFDINPTDLTFALAGTTDLVPANWTVEFGGPIVGIVGAVPEPSTYGLIGAGALALVVALRRRKQKSVQA